MKNLFKLQILMFLVIALILAGAIVPLSAAAQEGSVYIVQGDDSLWKIAEKYLGDGNRFPEIVQATNAQHAVDATFASITNPSLIRVGAKLLIPEAGTLPAPAGQIAPAAGTGVEAPPAQPAAVTRPVSTAETPAGQIAFSFWNKAPGRCTYEINVIQVQACLADSSTCQVNRRIFALNNASEPALSPEGDRLAFRGWGGIPEEIREGEPHPYAGCATPAANRWIQTATLDATDVRDITAYWEDSHPDWSPDGTKLLFDTQRLGDGGTYLMFIYTGTTGETAEGPYAEDLRLPGQQPSWAPDNERLVYRGCDLTGNRCGLWLARAIPVKPWEAGQNLIGPLLQEPEASQPDWSPVSNEIVYQSPVSGSWDLYVINADGSNKRRLTSDGAIEGLPTWSPDGQWIAYLSDQGGNWGIWIIRADGAGARQLFAFDGGEFRPKPIEPYGPRDWLDEQISWSR